MRIYRIRPEEASAMVKEILTTGLYKTQYDVARTIGVNYTTLNVWYNAHRGICNDDQANRLRKCLDFARKGERMEPAEPRSAKLGIAGILYGAICSYISDCIYIPNRVKGVVLAEVNDVIKNAIHNMPQKWQNRIK